MSSPILETLFSDVRGLEDQLPAAAEAAVAGDPEGAVQAAEITSALAAAQKKLALVAIAIAVAVSLVYAVKKGALPKMIRWARHPLVVVPALAVGATGALYWYKRSSTADAWKATATQMLSAQKSGEEMTVENPNV